MNGVQFAYPYVFLAPIAILILLAVRRPRTREAVPIASRDIAQEVRPSLRLLLRVPILVTLLALTIVCLTVAAARPQHLVVHEEQTDARNIMLAVDVSPSMQTSDMHAGILRISRMEAVKRVVAHFVRARPRDRVGLVVFAGRAYLQAPLTRDLTLVSQMVDALQVGVAGDGTAIGDGLGVALKGLREAPEGSRAIILVTDGANNSGQVNPQRAAKVAADLGIKIYTVGIGAAEALARVMPGVQLEYDEQTLREIAELTGGIYQSATDFAGLERVYQEISLLEESDATEPARREVRELYSGWVLAALLTFCLYLLLERTVFIKIP